MARILLIEDNKNILMTVRMCLEGAGHEVMPATDGISGLKLAMEERSIDLVLLDLVLPKMSGFLVLEALKEDPRTKHLPVVVISAKASEEDICKAKRLGAREYLVKPFEPRELLKTTRSALPDKEGTR